MEKTMMFTGRSALLCRLGTAGCEQLLDGVHCAQCHRRFTARERANWSTRYGVYLHRPDCELKFRAALANLRSPAAIRAREAARRKLNSLRIP